MKAQKVLAAIAVTALTASIAVGLTACGPAKLGKANLSIKNYIPEENTAGYYERKTPEVKNLLTVNEDEVYTESSDAIILNKGTYSDPSYTVYSLEFEKEILKNEGAYPERTSLGGIPVYCVDYYKGKNMPDIFKYVTLDGKVIVSISNYCDFNSSSNYYYDINTNYNYEYVNGEKEQTRVVTVTVEMWSKEDGTHTTNNYYFRSVTDKKTGAVSYEILKESQLGNSDSDDKVGAMHNGLYDFIYSEDENVEGEIAKYKYCVFGDTYTFYNGETETGSVEIKEGNGAVLGFVDNYMYYTEMNIVDSESSKYNYMISQYFTIKYNYSLYRYDVLKNSVKKLNYNVLIDEMQPIYNYTTKTYDAALISGYKMVDGVAVYDENVFTYIVDKNLKIAYDLHGEDSFTSLYDLGNGKYAVGSYIMDENLNPINSAGSSSNIYANEKLIKFQGANGYGFTDYSGKIVIEPKYAGYNSQPSFDFFGGAAHVYETQKDGSRKEALLKPDGTVTYVDDLTKTTSDDVTKQFNAAEGYYIIRTGVNGTDGVTYTYDVYANDGTALKKFTNDVDSVGYSMNYLKEYDSANGTYTYYKLG